MLYKILLVVASVFSMLASSLMPAGFISDPLADDTRPASGSVVPLQKLATLASDGLSGAGVSALWVEIDGERVDRDVTGHGYLKELRFKVGLRAAPGKSLAIGTSVLPLVPTDTITVREFTGKFQVVNAGSESQLVGLDGEVQATFVNEAHVEKIRTEGRTSVPKTPANLAYISLDIGKGSRQATVDLAPGGDAIATGDERLGVAPIPVRWLRVGDATLTDYTWNEGFAERLEFVAKPSPQNLVIGGKNRPVDEDVRVIVDKFVGTYVLFQTDTGELQLKLDGFAELIHVKPGSSTEALGLTTKPTASFDYEPKPPTTSDTVVFLDTSTATPGASILLREWDFGDGSISTANAPKHRFKEPGRAYTVTLVVTDSNLERSDPYTATIAPLNSRPVAEFDFSPKLPTDVDGIQFMDRSWDVDGPIASWLWDFGDATGASTDASPIHVFPDDGAYTVTLTVADAGGATNSISKVISVANVPPTGGLSFTPTDPTLLDMVDFTDTSSDPDGTIVESSWAFGDGSPVELGAAVRHRYTLVGDYPVTHTVKDDDGATTTVSTVVRVRNLAPWVSYEITTPAEDRTTGRSICFRDTSTDDENAIASRTWLFAGTTTSTVAEPCHTFAAQGLATVNLTVRDQRGAAASIEGTFMVLNGAPVADFTWTPVAPRTGDSIVFTSAATDPDGPSDITSYLWTFPDATTSTDPTATKSFADNGAMSVSLKVTDSSGHESTRTIPVPVANRPPRASFTADDTMPAALEEVTFTDASTDQDGTVTELIWAFDDDYTLRGVKGVGNISAPTHAFATTGLHRITLTAIDDDLAESTPFSLLIDVLPPPPVADFSWAPNLPNTGETTTFTDESYGIGTDVVEWHWSFGDGGTSVLQSPEYQFGTFGLYPVSLRVVDDHRPSQEDTVTQFVLVNGRPDADFASGLPLLHSDVAFTDTSVDPDGTIVSWLWDFGDGSPVSTAQHPTHRWDTAGSYSVTLTVVDDRGATGSATSLLRFDNRAPAAAFSFTPNPPVANATATFTSTATDAENTLSGWTWSVLTDAAVPVLLASGSGQVFDHVFPETGIYVVRLRVTDTDGGVSTTSQRIRVVSDGEKTIDFGMTYPDGTAFDVSENTIRTSFTLKNGVTRATSSLPSATLTGTDGAGRIHIPAGQWAAGDTVAAAFKSAKTNKAATPPLPLAQPSFGLAVGAGEVSSKTVQVFLPYEIRAEILPPGSTTGARGDYSAWTEVSPGVYAFPNQTEIVFARLVATWENSTNPVVGGAFEVTTMWTAIRTLFGGGDPTDQQVLFTSTPTVLSVTEVVGPTSPLGELLYDVPILAPVPVMVTNPLQSTEPAYLPGWYRVNARVSVSTAYAQFYPAAATAKVQFFEDPMGIVRPTFSGNFIFG